MVKNVFIEKTYVIGTHWHSHRFCGFFFFFFFFWGGGGGVVTKLDFYVFQGLFLW